MAQDVLRCELCLNVEFKSEADAFCNTCNVNLCETCVGHHIISMPSLKHNVMTLSSRKCDFKIPVCSHHSRQNCELYCQNCVSPVCVECIASGSHKFHDIEEINEVYKSKRLNAEKDKFELQNCILPKFDSIIAEIECLNQGLREQHTNRKVAITQCGKTAHEVLDKVIEKYLTEADTLELEDIKSVAILRHVFHHLKLKIESELNGLQNIMLARDFSKLQCYSSKVEELRIVPSRFQLKVPAFQMCMLSEDKLLKEIGSLSPSLKTVIPTEALKCNHELKLFDKNVGKKFCQIPKLLAVIDTGFQHTLREHCSRTFDKFYVSGDAEFIRLLTFKGDISETLTTMTCNIVTDITVTKDNALVYADGRDRTVNLVKDKKAECIIKLKDWKPWSVTSTSNNELLVSMWTDSFKDSKVVRFSGSLAIQEIQFREDGKPLYHYPAFVEENVNLDVIVSDINENCIVVTDKLGKLKFVYEGKFKSQRFPEFHPFGLATDRIGNILIADSDNHVIHIIDKNGIFIKYLDGFNLKEPYDISINDNDNLIVVEYKTGKPKILKYIEYA
ncbi:uncharacterized protein LOC134243359 [Saccostrea cucullata]|uniref:uncharacterized protein LOC134243359 n=1 Tax=Saccostrea cuccullata TaxID=36930 RepID=UPI002ED02D87